MITLDKLRERHLACIAEMHGKLAQDARLTMARAKYDSDMAAALVQVNAPPGYTIDVWGDGRLVKDGEETEMSLTGLAGPEDKNE